MLDGEGGYTVWGKLMPAAASLKAGALPIGLAHHLKLKRDVAHGAVVRWDDVEFDADNETIKTRRAMEQRFGGGPARGRRSFTAKKMHTDTTKKLRENTPLGAFVGSGLTISSGRRPGWRRACRSS